MNEEPTARVRCVIMGKRATLHLLDEALSKPGQPWAKCAWPPTPDSNVVPLAMAWGSGYAHYVRCSKCFKGGKLPELPAQSS